MRKRKRYVLLVAVALIVLSCGGRRSLPPPPPPPAETSSAEEAPKTPPSPLGKEDVDPKPPVRIESLEPARQVPLTVTPDPTPAAPPSIRLRSQADEAFDKAEVALSRQLYRRYLNLPEATDRDLVRFRLGWLLAEGGDYAGALKEFSRVDASGLGRVERLQLGILIPLLEGAEENSVLKEMLKSIRQDAPRRKPE